MKEYICEDRNKFIAEMTSNIINNPSNTYFFLGKIGTGKKYVLNKIEDNLMKKCKIYRITSDIFLEKNLPVFSHKFSVSFTLNSFIGLSLSPVKNDTAKINYIITNLKALTFKKSIVISAVDYDNLSSESRDFIQILLSNKNVIEEKVKKKISVILTGNYNYFGGNYDLCNINFIDYTKDDLSNYIKTKFNYSSDKLTNDKISQIYRLCGTNFNLVNCYCSYIIDQDTDTSIHAIIDKKLNYYISTGCKYNLSKESLENIIYTSSLSVETLTPKVISYVNNYNINDVELGFNCAVNENFLDKKYEDVSTDYLFISEEEKEYLYKREIVNRSNKLIQYYNYLSTILEDSYLQRAQFLYKYYKIINGEIFSLLVLELSKSYLLNDSIMRRNVEDFLTSHITDKALAALFYDINSAYQKQQNAEYKDADEIIERLDFSAFNIVLAAELRRLKFKCGSLGHTLTSQTMLNLSLQLKTYLDKKLILMNDTEFECKEEKLLSLRIIFDIAPYILDTRNDKENFNDLYDKSLILVNYIKENFITKSYSEYIINIFNRKAFLFAPPSSALLYYEEAEAYFKNNNVMEEYAVTLASKAGINIALHDYKAAIDNSQKAIDIIKENCVIIQQEEKIYNNLYIAKFLDFEKNNTQVRQLRGYAKLIIQELENLVTDNPCGKNHVILTNIASLYLYTNNETLYEKTKKRIEKSLNCQDVSNVLDPTVNDFYRYHFAWYEFYRFLKKEDWSECTRIVNRLKGFYPSIFHNFKKMDLRIEAAAYLIEHKKKLTAIEFCLHFLDYALSNKEDYFSRGLPLSDLQFTSLD